MNLILFSEADLISEKRVVLRDRRARHIKEIHRASIGDELKVGLINGLTGKGLVSQVSDDHVELDIELTTEPPVPLPLTLFLALPRPKFIARILQVVTSLGVKEIYIFNSYRVEKVYWSCQQITPEDVRESCLLGLEQARDTILPKVHFRKLFRPFVEDEVPGLIQNTNAFVAHPISDEVCPFNPAGNISLAVGPEGGFIDFEIGKLEEAGFKCVRTFDRILKVETAITSLIGRLV